MVQKNITDSSELPALWLLELYELFKFGTIIMYSFGIRRNEVF